MSVRVRQWIGFIIMLIGLVFLSSPFLIGAYQETEQQNIVAEFNRMETLPAPKETAPAAATEETAAPTEETAAPTEKMSEPTEETTFPVETAVPETTAPVQIEAAGATAQSPIHAFYQAAQAYNERLRNGGQDGMHALTDLEAFELDSRDYGFAENIVGTIRIPRLGVELGLYLGANMDNMGLGAALFGMTSIPLGQPGENAAIAGHRGWRGTPMFRDIQRMQMDDPIYIKTPWAQLEYRVCAIEIVNPDNLSWCRIQPGRSLITLMTCHPYGQNYQRYIVYAELVPGNGTGERQSLQTILAGCRSASLVTLIRRDGTREKVVLDYSDEAAVAVVHADGTREEASADAEAIRLLEQPEAAGEPASIQIRYPDGTQSTAVADSVAAQPDSEETPERTAVTVVHEDGTREITMVDSTAIDPDGREYGAVLSNVVIMAENKMRPIAMVMAVLVALVGIWLTVQTVRDFRRRKGESAHDSK